MVREKHGLTNSLAYHSYKSMVYRCYDERSPSYKNYGARGISVCDRWRSSFKNFYEDMGDRPVGTTLDRIDHEGNYEPSNCRWLNKSLQQHNKRTYKNNKLSAKGVTFTQGKYWARITVDKKVHSLGLYITIEEAVKAREEAELQLIQY